jgi:hypothetical protein
MLSLYRTILIIFYVPLIAWIAVSKSQSNQCGPGFCAFVSSTSIVRTPAAQDNAARISKTTWTGLVARTARQISATVFAVLEFALSTGAAKLPPPDVRLLTVLGKAVAIFRIVALV